MTRRGVNRMEPTVTPRRPAVWLVVSDGIAILTFVTIGLVSHHRGIAALGYAHDALPLLGGWYAAALALRLYQTQRPRRLLLTCAVGVPVGVLIRALVLGRAFNGKEAEFLGVALISILLLVTVLRSAIALTPPREKLHR
jgi:hypothetical protein